MRQFSNTGIKWFYTGVPELAPQRKQTNADYNLDSKNANEEQWWHSAEKALPLRYNVAAQCSAVLYFCTVSCQHGQLYRYILDVYTWPFHFAISP
jgi:hypothetical protein